MKFIKIKDHMKPVGWDLTKKVKLGGMDSTNLENLRQGCRGRNAWKIRQASVLVRLLLVAKVCRLRIRSHLVSLVSSFAN